MSIFDHIQLNKDFRITKYERIHALGSGICCCKLKVLKEFVNVEIDIH